ncbi:MAG: coenzyme F420-0:L-glutamate ligase [bacterium]|nr:coenzyme F420-0:L-glutamate ligase [bacterium]
MEKEISPNPEKKLEIKVDEKTYLRIPVKTPLILPESDYPTIYQKALTDAGVILQNNDIIFAGEKAIAIAEGRAWHKKDIRVTPLARFLVRFVTKSKRGVGISSPETFQLAINEAGAPRIILAALIGGVFKLLRIRGVFYLLAGRQVAMIDGAADYVIPPYNEYCSLGPKDPDASARRIAKKLGVPVTLVDANDYGIQVIGKSDNAINTKFIKKVIRDNPLGQTNEQTPFGVIRKKL